MRVRVLLYGLLVLALGFSAGGTLAGPLPQTGEQTYEGLFSFTYPANWQLRATNANQVMLFEDHATLSFYGPERVARLRALAPEETNADFLARFLDNLSMRVVEKIFAAGNVLAGSTLQPTRQESGMALLLDAGEGLQVVAVLRADNDVYPAVLADYQAIVATLTPGPIASEVTLESAIASAAASTPVPVVQHEACTVTAAAANSATVRVGPGENRTAITFLPADTAFTVLGVGEAADGSLWWKLDKAEVAPQSAAAELWVAQDDVTGSGDCAAVGAADAPPIIPITVQQPPASGGASGGQPASGGGPVASSGGGRSGVFITLPEWQAGLPPSLQAASPDRARVIVNVSQGLNTVQNCGDYRNSAGQVIQITRNKVVFTAQANDATTGQPLGPAGVFEGGEPGGCPSVILVNSTLNGPPPDVSAAIPWLESLLGM